MAEQLLGNLCERFANVPSFLFDACTHLQARQPMHSHCLSVLRPNWRQIQVILRPEPGHSDGTESAFLCVHCGFENALRKV